MPTRRPPELLETPPERRTSTKSQAVTTRSQARTGDIPDQIPILGSGDQYLVHDRYYDVVDQGLIAWLKVEREDPHGLKDSALSAIDQVVSLIRQGCKEHRPVVVVASQVMLGHKLEELIRARIGAPHPAAGADSKRQTSGPDLVTGSRSDQAFTFAGKVLCVRLIMRGSEEEIRFEALVAEGPVFELSQMYHAHPPRESILVQLKEHPASTSKQSPIAALLTPLTHPKGVGTLQVPSNTLEKPEPSAASDVDYDLENVHAYKRLLAEEPQWVRAHAGQYVLFIDGVLRLKGVTRERVLRTLRTVEGHSTFMTQVEAPLNQRPMERAPESLSYDQVNELAYAALVKREDVLKEHLGSYVVLLKGEIVEIERDQERAMRLFLEQPPEGRVLREIRPAGFKYYLPI